MVKDIGMDTAVLGEVTPAYTAKTATITITIVTAVMSAFDAILTTLRIV